MISSAADIEDLEELLERLGGIPANRVRMHPAPGTATEADVVAALEGPRKRLCELVDGTLVEKAMGLPESILASYLITILNNFVLPRNLGLVTAPDATIRLWPGLVRMPDVAFTSWDSMPGRRRPKGQVATLAFDLGVEIISPSNTVKEMDRKRSEYFAIGVKIVWQVFPSDRTIEVYTAPDAYTTLQNGDTLSGDPVLPGFTLKLSDLFGELDRHG